MIFHPQNTRSTIFRALSKEIAMHTVALRGLVNFKQRLVATIKQKSNRERSFKAFTLKSGFNGDSILPHRIKRELFFKQDCAGDTSLRFIFMRLHEIGCKSAQFCAWQARSERVTGNTKAAYTSLKWLNCNIREINGGRISAQWISPALIRRGQRSSSPSLSFFLIPRADKY